MGALSGERLHFNTFLGIAKLDLVAQSPVASGSSLGLSTHVHVAPSGEVFFQGRDQARQQTGT
jgi:acyl-ACP thioesterase